MFHSLGPGTFLPHTPHLCILTGTEPAVADFQLPFFRWKNHLPPIHVAVSGDYNPKEVKVANVSQGDAPYSPDFFSPPF